MVNTANVGSLEMGTVTQGRRDGEMVATPIVIKNQKAIKTVESGRKSQLSVGYTVDLDETPGTHPVYGKYDAIQRNIVVNHVALVDQGRAGNARLRLDGAMVMPMSTPGMLTSIVQGHQHVIDGDCSSTSWAMSTGSDESHNHELVRAPDGTITLSENAGHTHDVSTAAATTTTTSPTSVNNYDHRSNRMDPEKMQELIRSLNEQLKQAETREGASSATAASEKLRADTAEGRIITLTSDNEALRARADSIVVTTETEAYKAEKLRADAAEANLAKLAETMPGRIRERATLERKAGAVMGEKFRMDDLSDRQIMNEVVKRLDSGADVGGGVADGVVLGRFLSLIEGHNKNVRSQAKVAEVLGQIDSHIESPRTDAAQVATLDQRRKEYREQWKKPLPNSRTNKGA